MDQTALEAARRVAFRFLGYAARSRAEIEARLERDGFAPEITAAVIAELEARNYLNDAQFARDWIQDRADRKKYGRTRLAAELQRKGVDRETVQEALESVDDAAELRRALDLGRAKWPSALPPDADYALLQAEQRKISAFLQRRGFSWNIITQVLAELMANQEELS